ncbi:hypothetical protein BN8_00336 [Fibrisoma limi BUZ 3]|uniref:Acyl transferase n=1 Tax=Fibrisoma limi BUZ 3 TaxID=1185876 RepID=I2GBY9_9BACT|nr:acyltransferase [Fibrisoma limi]CCH51413.1 hypothetical protein BN8_00336 [Fibrisoma limi BUZ 3]
MSDSRLFSAEVAAQRQTLRTRILNAAAADFDSLALAVFYYQAAHNPVYATYLGHLRVRPEQVSRLSQIPFMPIGFFKRHAVLTGIETPPDTAVTFASSGTTGSQTSRHYVPDAALYDAISTRIFEQTYGPLTDFHILALLPSYLERNNSSLVYMVQQFMAKTGSSQSGFYLHNVEELTERLHQLRTAPDRRKVLLIGVTFALLDWAESNADVSLPADLIEKLVVMETGGMKGRRQELLREEVHQMLTSRLGVPAIHSEYGMTELLSQAYSKGEGVFEPSATLRVFLRDINDPFHLFAPGQAVRQTQTGGINVIDLANLDSCSFIETQDLGQYVGTEGAFRVIGRFDNSDIRGCNLMVV